MGIEMSIIDFYDPLLYDLNVGPGSRVSTIYLAEVKRRGCSPILDLGCGTGDVLLLLANAGFEVAGLDLSPGMLAKCKQRIDAEASGAANRIQLFEGRMESFRLNQTFGHIIIPNDGIAHLLDVQALRSAFDACHAHLCDGGNMTLDISFFDVEYLGRYVGREQEYLRDRGHFALDNGGAVQVWEETQFNQETEILTAKFRYEFLDDSSTVVKTYYRRLLLCPRRPSEVVLALEVAGFVDIHAERLSKEEPTGWIIRASKRQ
jgi:SAM-dependent methyltransferase